MTRTEEREILLSVCIPTSDRLASAKENVLRCLAYNLDWLDVIVTVDDPTNEEITELRKINDERYKCYVNKQQLGYANLAEALHNGDGRYCLLLSDVDRIFDADWEMVKNQLEINNEVGLYICDYYDSKGDIILNCRDGFLEKGSVNALNFAIRCTSWSGGIVLKRDSLHQVWKEIDKSTIIWYFYSQSVSALHIVKNENCARLSGLYILRGAKRERKKRSFECDENHKPYWDIHSRNKQIISWIREIALINRDVNVVKEVLFRSILMRNYDFLVKYFKSIHFDYTKYTTEFVDNNKDYFADDLSMGLPEWISMADYIDKQIKSSIISVFNSVPTCYENKNKEYKNESIEKLKRLYALRDFV